MTEIKELQPVSERGEKFKRGTILVLIEIDCKYTDIQTIPGGFVVRNGLNRCKVNREDLPAIQALVEPNPERVQMAHDMYEADLKEFIEQKTAGRDKDPGIEQFIESIRATYAGSPSGRFRDLNKRDMLPFASVKVIEDNILPDEDEEKLSAEEVMGSRIAAAIYKSLHGTAERTQTPERTAQQRKG